MAEERLSSSSLQAAEVSVRRGHRRDVDCEFLEQMLFEDPGGSGRSQEIGGGYAACAETASMRVKRA